MKVREVIEKLGSMPPEAEFKALYDCFCSIPSEVVWLSRSGEVLMSERGHPSTDEDDWPVGAIGKDSCWNATDE